MAKSNKTLVPEAKEAMNQFKMEAANDLDVPVPSKKSAFLRDLSVFQPLSGESSYPEDGSSPASPASPSSAPMNL